MPKVGEIRLEPSLKSGYMKSLDTVSEETNNWFIVLVAETAFPSRSNATKCEVPWSSVNTVLSKL